MVIEFCSSLVVIEFCSPLVVIEFCSSLVVIEFCSSLVVIEFCSPLVVIEFCLMTRDTFSSDWKTYMSWKVHDPLFFREIIDAYR